MGAAVGLASVSAVLLRLLESSSTDLAPYLSSEAAVTSGPPDAVGKDSTLNLFLYRVTRNAGWPDVPSRPPMHASRPAGETSSVFGPLVVDMHYALSAHSSQPLVAELLLGEAMLTLHEHQHIGRTRIAEILADQVTVSPPFNKPAVLLLPEAGALADQIESLTISSQPAGLEQLSQFWSAAQSPARSCALYLVTAVVLERLEPRPIPRIVLSRGPMDASGQEPGPSVRLLGDTAVPRLSHAEMDAGDPSALLGESVILRGSGLVAGTTVELSRGEDPPVSVALTSAEGDEARFVIDGLTGTWHPGVYSIRVRGANTASNALPLQLAPRADWANATLGPVAGNPATRPVQVTFEPQAAADQEVVLFVGGAGFRAEPGAVSLPATATKPARTRATFAIPDLPAGTYAARLSVDGIDSHQFDRSTRPPSLRDAERLVVN